MGTSYLKQRLEAMHLTENDIRTRLKYSMGERLGEGIVPFLAETDNDDIAITVYDLDRRVIEYDYTSNRQTDRVNDNAPLTKEYQVIRRSPHYLEEHPGAPKYMFPGGEEKKGTYPFLPPLLLDLYEQKKETDTLVLTEGYLKAIKACQCGIPCVGLGSVTLFADSRDGKLYNDIRRLILTCKPLNVVILYDADCLDIKIKDPNADLAKRPQAFYASLMKLYEMLLEFRGINIYFCFPLRNNGPDSPKGLDDLLIYAEEKQANGGSTVEEIVDDLLHPTRAGVFFRKVNLQKDYRRVKPMFGISNVKEFYQLHAAEIGEQEFCYNGTRYRYMPTEKDLVRILDGNMKNFFHIDNNFYERCEIVDPVTGAKEYQLLSRKKETVELLFDKEAPKQIVKQQHFRKFENYPDNINWQASVGECYNIYRELPWKPAPGEWPSIERLLKHIFPDEIDDKKIYSAAGRELAPVTPYNIALDYFTILYKNPRQMLPTICLVSQQRATGKTTFLNLLKYMFCGNCIIGGTELVLSRFNTAIAGKLMIGIDETNLAENAEVTEKIKNLSTAERIIMEGKGKDMVEMANFAKFCICSNNERKFMLVDKDEVRLWVIKVGKIESDLDVNINAKIQKEIPAFAHFLLNRHLSIDEPEHRMWFDPERLKTEELRRLQQNSASYAERTIADYIREMFEQIDTGDLWFDAVFFQDHFLEFRNKELAWIRTILEDKLHGVKSETPLRTSMPCYDQAGEITWTQQRVCRPYRFFRKDFVGS